MSRREHIVDTVHRIAEARERQAMVGLGRARAAHDQAATDIEALEAENSQVEAELAGAGVMGEVERELLWAHRAWARQERLNTEERLAYTEAELAQAHTNLAEKRGEARIRGAVKDRVQTAARVERDAASQKELDEIAQRTRG